MYDSCMGHKLKIKKKEPVTHNSRSKMIKWNSDIYFMIICDKESNNALKT